MNRLKRFMENALLEKKTVDLHLHTKHSIDVIEGNSFLDYAKVGEKLSITPGFLDHFQAEKLEINDYPFNEENIQSYLEEFERVKSSGFEIMLGLEVDFYSKKDHLDWNVKTMEFIENHHQDFDYFVGTIHDVFDFTITIPFELEDLLKQQDFKSIQEEYFKVLFEGIESRIFDGIAHLDVVYRFNGKEGMLESRSEYKTNDKTWNAMNSCIETETLIELNLRGLEHPWNTTYPSEILVRKFMSQQKDKGPYFFTGSDSHNVTTFERMAPITRKYNKFLQQQFS